MNKPNTTQNLALGLLIVLVLVASFLTLLADRAHSEKVAVPNSGYFTYDRPSETIDLTTIHPADRKFFNRGYLNHVVNVKNAEHSPSDQP